MTRLERIEARLRILSAKSEASAEKTHSAWMQLVETYNVPSWAVEEFYSAAFSDGIEFQEKLDLQSEKYNIERVSRLTKVKRKLFNRK